MENKDTVIDAKIVNLNELTKVLSVKEQAQEQLLAFASHFYGCIHLSETRPR